MMTIHTRFNWLEQLLAPIDKAKVSQQITENNSDWEYIDSEMIKLGSLNHSSLNIDEIQRRCLHLFATETKDFRLFVHLLRTLQHAGKADELVLAANLITQYSQHYWQDSYPQNMRLKQRLTQQILKRFETAQTRFCKQATPAQRDDILGFFAYLAQFWHTENSSLSTEVDALSRAYYRLENIEQPTLIVAEDVCETQNNQIEKNVASPQTTSTTQIQAVAISQPTVEINQSDDRQWKQTLLKVAAILCEQSPSEAIGYRLRRYAIWHNIQTLPISNHQGKTPLASVSIDRITDYRTQLAQPSLLLLNDIEQSLTLAPYWLDGHFLAAKTAQLLGFEPLSQAIAETLALFLARLPQLHTLYFSDMTAFISEETQQWLTQLSHAHHSQHSHSVSLENEHQEIMLCFEQQGLNAALLMIDNAMAHTASPRIRFYLQLLSAQLFDASDMKVIANTYFQQLYQDALRLSLSDWEPDLLNQLASKIGTQQDTTFDRK